ncbi:MAG: hypothetical protein R2797_08305 [Gelidibacter sp.]
MIKITQLSKVIAITIALFFGAISYAQIGIGTTAPLGGSILDITSTTKGLLVPRINITNLATIAPVTGGAPDGLLVWSTNATNSGYHYWSVAASRWIPLLPATATTNDWALIGNNITAAGGGNTTTIGTNFVGTTSNTNLNFRSNNTLRMRVQANGQITVNNGATAAAAGDQLAVYGTYAVNGYTTSATGIGVYGQATSGIGVGGVATSGSGVVGQATTGYGVEGYNASSGDAVHAEHDGSGNAVDAVAYGTGVGVYAENYLWTDYAVHAVDGSRSVYADNTLLGLDAIVADTDDTVSNSLWARNFDALGTAVLGSSNNLSVYSGTTGSGLAGSGTKLGVFGYAGAGANIAANYGNAAGQFTLDSDSNPGTNGANNGTRASATLAGFDNVSPDGVQAAATSYFGAYFTGGSLTTNGGNITSYAYAGMKYNADANGRAGTNYKIIGNGTNSTIIRDKENVPRILFSPEAPEILFEDYGTGKLVNGVANIIIDPILRDAIYVDDKHPLKVFIQLEGDCNGVFVTNKSANGFTVKELANGNSNVSFSYHIVANRADDVDVNGEVSSKHVGLRFPVGPGPLKEKELSVRKEGDNKVGKDFSIKKRPERKDKVKKEEVKGDSEENNQSSETK